MPLQHSSTGDIGPETPSARMTCEVVSQMRRTGRRFPPNLRPNGIFSDRRRSSTLSVRRRAGAKKMHRARRDSLLHSVTRSLKRIDRARSGRELCLTTLGHSRTHSVHQGSARISRTRVRNSSAVVGSRNVALGAPGTGITKRRPFNRGKRATTLPSHAASVSLSANCERE
jgi:hypothetical protein